MTNILAHVDRIRCNGGSRSSKGAAHSLKHFFLLFWLPSLYLPRRIFHIVGEGCEIAIDSMSVWTCASPVALMVEYVEFCLLGWSLNKIKSYVFELDIFSVDLLVIVEDGSMETVRFKLIFSFKWFIFFHLLECHLVCTIVRIIHMFLVFEVAGDHIGARVSQRIS